MTRPPSAAAVVAELRRLGGGDDARPPAAQGDTAGEAEVFGVRMRTLFDAAKAHRDVPLDVVDELFDHPAYEPRLTACCILDFKARTRLDEEQRTELYDLYLRRHDRITTWGMVDRAAPRVVGGHLAGRDLAPLHDLAGAPEPLRRRTAITAPLYFVKAGNEADLAGGFAIAHLLAEDPEPVVHNAVGIFVKHAGRRDADAMRTFLDAHAATMPRHGFRLAVEKLDRSERSRYLARA
jgi:3-methyladenine DNA glycosylase AlkD